MSDCQLVIVKVCNMHACLLKAHNKLKDTTGSIAPLIAMIEREYGEAERLCNKSRQT